MAHILPENSGLNFIHNQLGTILVGTWLEMVLYTVEMWQLFRYYRKYRNDVRALRFSVLALAAVDSAAVAVANLWVYRATISDFGALEKAVGAGWELCAVVAVNLYAATITQAYLIYRYHRISKSRYLVGFLALAVLCVSGCSIFVVYALTRPDSPELLVSGTIAALIMFGLEAFIDIAIAAALAIFLIKAVKTDIVDRTKRLLVKLAFIAVESGCISAILAIITLVTTLTLFDTSNLPYLFVMLLGRVYALTLLFNLNLRKSSTTQLGSSGDQEGITPPGQPKHNQGQVSVFQLAELRSASADNAKVPPPSMRHNELDIEYTKETFTRMDV